MAYKIIDIEGVGDVYAEKLQTVGIKTVDDLLDRCAAAKGRKELEEATGISGKLILRLPQPLHQRAAELAAENGISLNEFITRAIRTATV